jgi:hypothetical protein
VEAWHDFFIAEAGASAALAGLLFVALSLNITRILDQHAWLVARAAQSVAAMMLVLLVASIALLPIALGKQGLWWLILTIAGTIFTARATLAQAGVPPAYRRYAILNAVANLLLYVPAVAGSVIVTAGNPEGIGWMAFALIYALVYATYNAWVLLVEILR